MVTLSLTCPGCGTRITQELDEQLFPSALRCRCGTNIPLTVEEEPARSYALPDFEENDTPEDVWLYEAVHDSSEL